MKSMKAVILSAVYVCAASAAPIALGQEGPVRVLRIYDARDVVRGEGDALRLAARATGFGGTGNGSGASSVLELVPQLVGDAEKDIVLELATAIGLYASRVREGIYVASGPTEVHQQFESALDAFRGGGGVGGVRYILNVEAVQVAGGVLPSPGQPSPALEGDRLLRSSQTVIVQAESVVQSTTSEQYVCGWIPIVGTQAVGYQAQLATAEDGFVGTLLVGSIDAPDGHVSIQLAGWLLDSEVQNKAVTIAGDTLSFGVVRRQERGIQTSIIAPIGDRVVLAAVNGFEPNTIIVVTGLAVPVGQK